MAAPRPYRQPAQRLRLNQRTPYDQIKDFAEAKSLIPCQQFGFQARRSSALLLGINLLFVFSYWFFQLHNPAYLGNNNNKAKGGPP